MRARRAKGWGTFGRATLGIALASLGLLDTRADAAPAATYGAEIGSVLQSWHTPPLFVVGDHFVIAPLRAGAEFRCVQGDGVLSQVAEDVTFQHTIAWRRGASTLALLAGIAGTFSVHEVSCGGPSVAIDDLRVPTGAARSSRRQLVWWQQARPDVRNGVTVRDGGPGLDRRLEGERWRVGVISSR